MSNGRSGAFDELLREINPLGTFQKKWFCLLVLPFLCIYSFTLNFLFLASTPAHWCHVPGRESTGYTVEQWRQRTIPVELTADGGEEFSRCAAHNITSNSTSHKCQHGYEYDQSVYYQTLVSYYNWTCDQSDMASLFFTLTFAGMVVGALVFGSLSDYLGRKPVFMLTMVILVIFGTASMFAADTTTFMTLWFFRATVSPICYVLIYLYCTEFLLPEYRERFNLIANSATTLAMALLALIAWLCNGYWFYTGLATTLPFLYLLIFVTKMPESARWLASKNRIEEAAAVIRRIATENKVAIPENLEDKLKSSEDSEPSKTGVLQLLKLPRQVLRLVIITAAWTSVIITYNVIHLNLITISSNIYLEFFIISIIEIPGYVLGLFLVKFGRRFSTAGCFLCNGLLCLLAMAVPAATTWPLIGLMILVKLGVSALINNLSVHTPELFSTEFRAIACTVPNMLSSMFNLLSPYIAALGDTYRALPFIVLGVLSLLCAPAYLFLPETKNRSLPQTIEDAERLGEGHKFWNLNLTLESHRSGLGPRNKKCSIIAN